MAVAYLRTLCNGWLTTRRLVHGAQRCLLGCYVVGDDDVRHYFSCPAVCAAILAQTASPPAWARPGPEPLRILFLLDASLPDAAVLLMGEWAYVLYMVYNTARAHTGAWTETDAVAAFRA